MSRRLALVAALAATACCAAAPSAGAAQLTARGSAEQVQVTGAKPGARLALVDRRGRTVGTRKAGRLGGAVFRAVRPGSGYRVRGRGGATRAVTVLSTRPAPPSTKGYAQRLPKVGYGYLTTRDGTKLAINVQLPGGNVKPPYPTLVECSGYGYANPAGGESSIAQIATILGYAVVDVNMRGTGCSGGAFDYFEPLQGLDGYDVIETVAHQPWVAHHRPGMFGISYGGVSHPFAAPPPPPPPPPLPPPSVVPNTPPNPPPP